MKDINRITDNNGRVLQVGNNVVCVEDELYEGLKGYIVDIKTVDKETENLYPDVYCNFGLPESREEIAALEARFSEAFGETKGIDDIALDLVIMAPYMISFWEQEQGYEQV